MCAWGGVSFSPRSRVTALLRLAGQSNPIHLGKERYNQSDLFRVVAYFGRDKACPSHARVHSSHVTLSGFGPRMYAVVLDGHRGEGARGETPSLFSTMFLLYLVIQGRCSVVKTTEINRGRFFPSITLTV